MNGVEPPPRFFVAHMQKTAGTALRDRLRATFPESQIYPNGTDGPDARIAVISVAHLQERWAARGDEIRLLTGHFPVRTVELLDAPLPTMTVLRDPVERTLSFLRHQAARSRALEQKQESARECRTHHRTISRTAATKRPTSSSVVSQAVIQRTSDVSAFQT